MELPDEIGNVRILVDGAFHDFKTTRTQIGLDATQNLSGFLAVRSSEDDEGQTDHLPAQTAQQELLAIGQLDHELGGLARNLLRERAGCERNQ